MEKKNIINWDEYFMGMAQLSALRSKDPSTQVGAVIVNDDYIVGEIRLLCRLLRHAAKACKQEQK